MFFFKITSGGACGALAIAFRPENAAATLYQCFLATGLQFRSVYMLLDSLPVDFASLKSRKLLSGGIIYTVYRVHGKEMCVNARKIQGNVFIWDDWVLILGAPI